MEKLLTHNIRYSKTVYLFIFYSLIVTFSSCISDENGLNHYSPPLLSETINTNVVLKINKSNFELLNANRVKNINKGDDFKINTAKRIGDLILLNVTFPGGCKDHTFEIVWDGIVYKENPCKLDLLVMHNSNGDLCEALYSTDLVINLKELLGDVAYKNSCDVYVFSTFNATTTANVVVLKNE
ncbi:MAG: hypothetical protein KBE41_08900 [Lutibacter sp.]|nr:hypothetical protein [Lutibacter sp.]